METSVSSRAPNERRRRRKNKKAAAAVAPPPLTGPTSIQDLPADQLKLILLRLDSTVWIIRAASVCKLWRGIIAGDADADDFLRLSRALHPPAIAGHYHLTSDPTAFVPSSPPAIVGSNSRFRSFDFLPPGKTKWEVSDCHGGLVLLKKPSCGCGCRFVGLPDLIVCNPMTKQYQGILSPRGLTYEGAYAAYLLDGDGAHGGGGGGISMSNFRVLYLYGSYSKHQGPTQACVFTTAEAGDWRHLGKLRNDLGDFGGGAHLAGRLDGSLCMGLRNGRVMVLDNATLEFSQLDLPGLKDPWAKPRNRSSFSVVHSSGEGMAPQTARIVHVYGDELEVFRRERSDEWLLEHRLSEVATRRLGGDLAIPGKKMFEWIEGVVASGVGFVVLVVQKSGRRWLVTVDVETMKIEHLPEQIYYSATCPYTLPWPPLLQACVGQSRGRRRSSCRVQRLN